MRELDTEESKILRERLLFKFLENNFEKVNKLIEISMPLIHRISDFDLEKFKEIEEIEYLENDFNFELVALATMILAYLCKSTTCKSLLKDQGANESLLVDKIHNKLSPELIGQILSIQLVRCENDLTQSALINSLNE